MKVLVVQPGHSGRVSGATGASGEQEMANSVSRIIANTAPPGWLVRIIPADTSISQYMGDAFVAIHGDGGAASASGASVGYRNQTGAELAAAWKEAYRKVWPGKWKADNYTANLAAYYGTGKAAAAGNPRAIVIEVGFMSSPTDRPWIDAHHREIAASIWAAVAGTATQGGSEEVIVLQSAPEGWNRFWRLRNSVGDYLYTASADEINSALRMGYLLEGSAFDIAGSWNTTPLFRMLKDGFHMYCLSAERDVLVRAGWTDEGVVANVGASGVPVYRLARGNAHLFTMSSTEKQSAIAAGWVDEGIAFYCGTVKAAQPESNAKIKELAQQIINTVS